MEYSNLFEKTFLSSYPEIVYMVAMDFKKCFEEITNMLKTAFERVGYSFQKLNFEGNKVVREPDEQITIYSLGLAQKILCNSSDVEKLQKKISLWIKKFPKSN